MKKGRVLKLWHFGEMFEFFKKNNLLMILTLFFIGGFCFGIYFCSKETGLFDFSKRYIADYISNRTGYSFISVLFRSFFSSMLFIAVCFISGSSMLGIILVPFICSVKGLLLGTVAANLYIGNSLNGIAFYAVLILPSAVISVIAIILASKESIWFSLLLARLTFPSTSPKNLSFDFKNYCVKYLSISAICFASALLDGILSVNFLKSFNI